MPQITNNETLDVRGTLNVASGVIALKDGQLPRAKLTQEELVAKNIPLTDLRVWDDLDAFLPAAAAADDLGLVDGAVWGTNAPTVQGSDVGGTTATQYARMFIPITEEFDTGETMKIRVRCGMNTTIADTTATMDVEAYLPDGDGAVGSDLCTTAAISFKYAPGTETNCDFTIDTATITIGDVLDCRLTMIVTDAGDLGVMMGEIYEIKLLRDIKG